MGVLDAFMQPFYITDHEHALQLFKAKACMASDWGRGAESPLVQQHKVVQFDI
jgi:hypothetical protein